MNRQDYLRAALDWVSGGSIDNYMSNHRKDADISELKKHFTSVIDWVSSVFIDLTSDMCGLEWGRLYDAYHKTAYNPSKVSEKVHELYDDPFIKNHKGIFEYILGGEKDTKLLDVRIFDEAVKRRVYNKQTAEAKEKGVSNCPLCAVGHEANKDKIYALAEMDADHVSAWSKGGATTEENCQMLCKTHNRAKGNR